MDGIGLDAALQKAFLCIIMSEYLVIIRLVRGYGKT